MPHPENPFGRPSPEQQPGPLPPELAEYLQGLEYAALLQDTSAGTCFLLKVPSREIESVRGSIPINIRSELYQHPAAPVVRTLLRVYDQPFAPLALETFTNIADDEQRNTFAQLAIQRHTHLLFYDDSLTLRVAKQLRAPNASLVRNILSDAQALLARIPEDEYDFDAAKAAVMAATAL